MVSCPFCGAPETDRFDLEGRRFLVFRCLFSPEVNPAWSDEELAARLPTEFGPDGAGYVRRTCDRLHLYVTQGEGGKALQGARPAGRP